MISVVLFSAAIVAVDPQYADNITVYHVNPHQYGAIPVNMDTADAAGDLFFDMHNVFLEPFQCPNGAASGSHCSNPEATAPNLVVNKLVLNVDSRYSGYAKCNIGVNGTDGHGNVCKDDTYCCYCAGPGWNSRPIPCNNTLGRENVTEFFGGHQSNHGGCGDDSPDYECWRSNLAKKFTPSNPGWWYSSLDKGYCPDHKSDPNSCRWEVSEVVKVVNKTCHDKSLWTSVRTHDTANCFGGCAGTFPNTTDPCNLRCFFNTVLGPDAGKAGGAVTGIPLEQLTAAWDKPFQSEDEGGCPALPIPLVV